jgi:hypothetical protein
LIVEKLHGLMWLKANIDRLATLRAAPDLAEVQHYFGWLDWRLR